MQNNKLPKITTIKSLIEAEETIKFEGRILEIQRGSSFDDPFSPTQMILIPEIWVCTRQDQLCDQYQMQFESKQYENGMIENRFFLEYDQIIGSPKNSIESIYYRIYYIECSKSALNYRTQQYICDNTENTQKFIDHQFNSVTMAFSVTEFNTRTKQLDKIQKSVEKIFSSKIQQFYWLSLKITNLQVDDGIRQDVIEQDILSFPLTMNLRLDQIKAVTYIEYPKISEILAETGAIISWILQISFIVTQYNEKICSNNTINDVIRMYFPDFSNLTIKRNIFGRIISASIKDKYYDTKRIERLMRRITNIANHKVSFINLQYEISRSIFYIIRLQLILTKQLGLPRTAQQNLKNKEKILKTQRDLQKTIENYDTYFDRINDIQKFLTYKMLCKHLELQLTVGKEYLKIERSIDQKNELGRYDSYFLDNLKWKKQILEGQQKLEKQLKLEIQNQQQLMQQKH